MISFLDYLKTTIKGNVLVSALGTNHMFSVLNVSANFDTVFSQGLHFYNSDDFIAYWCGGKNFIIATSFVSLSPDEVYYSGELYVWINLMPSDTTIVNGFFTGCTPLEAILESTLDCLYEIECLQLLLYYFPKLNQVRIVCLCISQISLFFR